MARKPSDASPRIVIYTRRAEHERLKAAAEAEHLPLATWMRVTLLRMLDSRESVAQSSENHS